jgi:peptidoglycan/LPS O-acetylase OafA/YrhL
MVGTLGIIVTLIVVVIFSVAYYRFFKYCIRTRLEAIKISEDQIIQLRYESQMRRLDKQAKDVELVYIERE